ncbi:hypothetical protein AUK41_01535 [Candidatus Berkelbacteria bacterium CG2_30_43_20]|uniref:Uncharacterized protein n=1 Tax=Candidatus Berkelbacteria bacterium CG10_big_fil_rev_8_21_14_0_10_43_14 TaxID=1974515 RepID=A0A2M6R9D1_9BACT|nr:MAG: hypothetical protein AUK41_01535 [Candidatus Berkelbacteria bacterium CG2_30_43_20]PIS07123.1 MAG: hypothetical protein COT79_00940 [Candidatus Berkelbacteria bacterium CG10_big_fil_rev_8_21_14_0_10_43_14]
MVCGWDRENVGGVGEIGVVGEIREEGQVEYTKKHWMSHQLVFLVDRYRFVGRPVSPPTILFISYH